MRHALHAALAAASLLAAPAALAEGFSYTYVDGRYFSSDSDATHINLSGAALSGSLALTETFFVAGDFSYGKTEDIDTGSGNVSFDLMDAALRIGAHHALTPVLDVVASAGVLQGKIDGNGANTEGDDDTGYIVQAGLRLAVIESFEIGAGYDYRSLFDETEGAFVIDAEYRFTPNWSVVGAARNADAYDYYNVGARYNF
jgi:hypothetical protein